MGNQRVILVAEYQVNKFEFWGFFIWGSVHIPAMNAIFRIQYSKFEMIATDAQSSTAKAKTRAKHMV